MTNEFPKEFSSTGHSETCPHIGLSIDSSVCYSYPHVRNLCHQVARPDAVEFTYQENHCLTLNFNNCEIYKDSGITHLSKEIKYVQVRSQTKWTFPRRLSPIAFTIVFLMILFYAFQTFQGYIAARPEPTNQFTELDSTSIFATLTPGNGDILGGDELYTQTPMIGMNTTVAIPTMTRTTIITALSPSTPGPGLMTPFGPEGQFVYHEVQPGESLALIANAYDTTLAVLEVINVFLQDSSFGPGQIILVMPTKLSTSDLTTYQIIKMDVRTRVVDISDVYDVPIEELNLINSLGEDGWLPIGRLLIVPYIAETN